MKSEYISTTRKIRIIHLPGETMADSFSCYDPEVDISMIFTKRNYAQNIRGMPLTSRTATAPDLFLELSEERSFAYLEFFHSLCEIKDDLEFKPERKVRQIQVKFERISHKYYQSVKAYSTPDYSTVYFKLTNTRNTLYTAPCKDLVLESDKSGVLCGLWILNIIPDPHYKITHVWEKSIWIKKPRIKPRIDGAKKVFFSNC